jgi:uncharacterized protein (DUF1330 family)
MSAYVISEVEQLEQEAWDHYRALAADSIARFGGKYLVRGAAQEVVEGAARSRKIVIVEFPDMITLKAWYRSEEYAKALTFKNRALQRELVFVEGV